MRILRQTKAQDTEIRQHLYLMTQYALIRKDMMRRSLLMPLDGTNEAIKRGKEQFDIREKGKTTTVSIDCLKPCHIMNEDVSILERTVEKREKITTRSGRQVKRSQIMEIVYYHQEVTSDEK